MATNFVSVVMQFLTPDMIAKIASVLGLDRDVAQKAVGGAVPALLSSFADVASAPNGARQLTSTLTQQSGSLESLKNLIGGSGQNSLAETGSSMLSGLFGGGTLDTMAQTIGKFAGIGEGTSKSMLGMLGPVVLGALGQQQRSAGLDASGLVSLLTSQKDQIAAAIPSGLAGQLSAAGLIDGATGSLRSGAAAASAAGGRIAEASERTVSGPVRRPLRRPARQRRHNGPIGWSPRRYWVVLPGSPLVVRGGHSRSGVASRHDADRDRNRGHGPGRFDGRRDESGEPDQLVGWFHQVLASRHHRCRFGPGALPKLKEATAQLNEVSSRATQLSPEGKSTLVKLIVAATPTINQMCDKVLATPGAGDIAKPAIDELRGKLDALARS